MNSFKNMFLNTFTFELIDYNSIYKCFFELLSISLSLTKHPVSKFFK